MLIYMVISVALAQASGKPSVEVLPGPVEGRVGLPVTLPCWISPSMDAEPLEVRWYRPGGYDSPVLLYTEGRVQENQYRNRSSLTRRSPESKGLKEGDVSLRLENLGLQDEGVFYCYVSGEWYDSQTVTLSISALGRTPVLSPQPLDDDTHVNVSCRSSGWFPEPRVLWRSSRGRNLSTGGLSHTRGTDGTFSVHSWTLVSLSHSPHVFCVLSLNSGEKREGAVDIQALGSSHSEGPWKALFITSIFALLALLGFVLYKHKEKLTGANKRNSKEKGEQGADKQTASQAVDETIKKLRENAVVITLDRDSAHPDLVISKDLKVVRDSKDYQQKEDGVFPYELCVCGAQTFTSGRHYWEVQLANDNVDPKCFWLIGVVKVGNYRSADKASLTPSNGFWFLCSDGPKGFYTNTEPPVTLSVSPRPQRVGVLLDYDGGHLSIYDVTEDKHILTISTGFSAPVAPLFNPGVGDIGTLRIIDVPVPEESPAGPCEPLLQDTKSSV